LKTNSPYKFKNKKKTNQKKKYQKQKQQKKNNYSLFVLFSFCFFQLKSAHQPVQGCGNQPAKNDV